MNHSYWICKLLKLKVFNFNHINLINLNLENLQVKTILRMKRKKFLITISNIIRWWIRSEQMIYTKTFQTAALLLHRSSRIKVGSIKTWDILTIHTRILLRNLLIKIHLNRELSDQIDILTSNSLSHSMSYRKQIDILVIVLKIDLLVNREIVLT